MDAATRMRIDQLERRNHTLLSQRRKLERDLENLKSMKELISSEVAASPEVLALQQTVKRLQCLAHSRMQGWDEASAESRRRGRRLELSEAEVGRLQEAAEKLQLQLDQKEKAAYSWRQKSKEASNLLKAERESVAYWKKKVTLHATQRDEALADNDAELKEQVKLLSITSTERYRKIEKLKAELVSWKATSRNYEDGWRGRGNRIQTLGKERNDLVKQKDTLRARLRTADLDAEIRGLKVARDIVTGDDYMMMIIRRAITTKINRLRGKIS